MENKSTLFERYLNGDISREELQRLLSFFEEETNGETELDDRIRQVLDDRDSDSTDPDYISSMLERNATKLNAVVRQEEKEVRKVYRLSQQQWLRIAAVFLSVLAGLGYWRFYDSSSDLSVATAVDIAPGTDRAVLILDDDRTIVLDSSALGIVNKEDVVQYADGTLLAAVGNSERLILRTPKGGQFRVSLPDGTQAWLNADSEISYPVVFDNKERKLSVRGEVYLEVAKERNRPFIVESDNQRIEVLGTHFNVNAYRDNGRVITTLSEGSVRVIHAQTGEELVLKPGDQVQIAPQGRMKVQQVDITEIVSWKEGLYVVHDQELGLFAKQLERWYDVDVDMSTFNRQKLSAVIPRDATLATVLDAIALKTDVQFRIEGRRVTAVKK